MTDALDLVDERAQVCRGWWMPPRKTSVMARVAVMSSAGGSRSTRTRVRAQAG